MQVDLALGGAVQERVFPVAAVALLGERPAVLVMVMVVFVLGFPTEPFVQHLVVIASIAVSVVDSPVVFAVELGVEQVIVSVVELSGAIVGRPLAVEVGGGVHATVLASPSVRISHAPAP